MIREAESEDVPEYNEELFETSREVKYIVLIIYDISDNKHRLKISKYLNSFGQRVQKSCFEARLNKNQYRRLIEGLKKKLKEDDNVRVYKILGQEEIETFGNKDYEELEDVIII
ncbi:MULTISPECIES: CRISPR-associated endonuclease Cas2 [unclassified Bilifractor]|uniref:CRISPR-associated endonuclease Cas2 n=1 Tax=unclassified Bilifractor TaxID=2815795 RepID=UPI003F93CFC6